MEMMALTKRALSSLSYTTVDDTVAVIAQLGTGTLLARVDIESAYSVYYNGWTLAKNHNKMATQTSPGRT